jgi:dolichol-phosphate mannosyltransferase
MRKLRPSTKPVSLVIPCLNEELNLPGLVERLNRMQVAERGWEVIIVDDGSTDNTATVAKQLSEQNPWLHLVRHPRNLGLGAAMRTGFLNAHGEIFCSMDSDCTFAPERLPELVAMVESGQCDVATGSPWHPESEQGTVNPFRKVLSQGCSLLYRIVLRSDLHSYTSLFRAYRREVIEVVNVESNGFVAVAETLVFALRAGFKVKELPVRLDKRIHGESKIGIVASVKSHARFLSKLGRAAWQTQPTPRTAVAGR